MTETLTQDELRDLFIERSGPTNTTPCPVCLPGLKRKGRYFFHRGSIAGYPELCAMKCNNCGFIRVSKKRAKSEGQTPAQAKAIAKVQRLFTDLQYDKTQPLRQWEVTADEHGGFWVSVKTVGNLYSSRGAHIHIGNRGSIEVWSVYDLTDDKTRVTKFYAEMLDATISKYAK